MRAEAILVVWPVAQIKGKKGTKGFISVQSWKVQLTIVGKSKHEAAAAGYTQSRAQRRWMHTCLSVLNSLFLFSQHPEPKTQNGAG